jgi:hypothetical protein
MSGHRLRLAMSEWGIRRVPTAWGILVNDSRVDYKTIAGG